jgi:low temperature requirement protein LtrA
VTQQLPELERPVAPLELFFDLVFVFGFTQVTTLLSEQPTWTGVGHALLILAVLWWAWASYAWLTNNVDAGEGTNLAVILAATAAMFVGALAVPEAFGDHGVLFGAAFLVVSVMQAALYALAVRDDRDFLAAIQRVFPWVLGGATLILVAGFFDGTLRVVLWVAALALGLVAPGLAGLQGWRVQPAHFVERHGLIVIIAIGESLSRSASERETLTSAPASSSRRCSGSSSRWRSGSRTSTSSRSEAGSCSTTAAARNGSRSRAMSTRTCTCR